MVVAMVSDIHGQLPEIPACDLLLLAGDICPEEDHSLKYQARWLGNDFREWLEGLAADNVVACAGNHDYLFDLAPDLVPELPWTYLKDSGAQVAGLKIWGSPWTPYFHGMAYNAPEDENDELSSLPKTESEPFLTSRYALVPDDTDILVVHAPPRGYGDFIDGHHVGSKALLTTIDRVQPLICVFGHIHQGRGRWRRGQTQLFNATVLDAEYNLIYRPYVVSIPE